MTLNQQVAGSNPAGCTKNPEYSLFSGFFVLNEHSNSNQNWLILAKMGVFSVFFDVD